MLCLLFHSTSNFFLTDYEDIWMMKILFPERNEAVSKACHPALDAGSPEKKRLIIRGLRVKPAMTDSSKTTFETDRASPLRIIRLLHSPDVSHRATNI